MRIPSHRAHGSIGVMLPLVGGATVLRSGGDGLAGGRRAESLAPSSCWSPKTEAANHNVAHIERFGNGPASTGARARRMIPGPGFAAMCSAVRYSSWIRAVAAPRAPAPHD
jgi:hypothetical protein